MPFIGKQPEVGAYSKLDAITTSATATYNLTLGSAAYYPSSANHLLVSLNGVMQAPQDSFTVSGSTIVFASTLTSTDSIDFIMALGDVLDIGTPSDGTVTSAKIVSGAVTSAKLDTNIAISGNLTTGNITTGNTSIVTGGRFISSQTSNDPWLKGVNSSNTETSYIKKDGQIYSAFGISLGGTGAANTLDDYEEGTWTPSPAQGTWTVHSARYTKVGRLVNCSFKVTATVGGTGGDITGMPFTALDGSGNGVVGFQNWDAAAWTVHVETSKVSMRKGPTSQTLGNAISAYVTFTYFTA
jgi:glycine cleavage system H lipoate-binding protein